PSASRRCWSASGSGANRSSTARCSTMPSGQGSMPSLASPPTKASCEISPASCIVARSIFFYTDSRELGGAENAMLMLLESLAAERWRPTLLLNDAASADRLAELGAGLGVPVARVPEMPLGLSGARRVPALARLLRRESPDLFHAHLSAPLAAKWGLSAAVLARIPTVATVQLVPAFE